MAHPHLKRAIEAARTFLAAVDALDDRVTLEDLIAAYEAEKIPGLAPSSQGVYRSWLRLLRRVQIDGRPIGELPVAEVTLAHAQQVLRWNTATPHNGAQIARQLGRVFQHAIDTGRHSGPNPVAALKTPPVRRREHPLDASGVRRVLAVLDLDEVGPRGARFLLRFLLLSGWRIGEARKLRVEHVQTRTFEDLRFAMVELPRTKGGPQRRQVSGAALSVLLTAAGGREHGPVFTGARGGRGIALGTIRDTLTAACSRAQLERRTPHDLRHTLATYLLRRGVPPADVARLLGHNDQRTTLRYSHANNDEIREALRLVDRLQEDGAA